MEQRPGSTSGQPGVSEMMERFLGLPSPEKVIGELQRLNNNLEILQPDIHKLSLALDGLDKNQIANLTAALNGVNVGNAMRILNEFNHLGKQVYERLWGKQ